MRFNEIPFVFLMGGQDKRLEENFVASSNYEIRKLNFQLKQGSKENSSLLFDVINNTVGVFFSYFTLIHLVTILCRLQHEDHQSLILKR